MADTLQVISDLLQGNSEDRVRELAPYAQLVAEQGVDALFAALRGNVAPGANPPTGPELKAMLKSIGYDGGASKQYTDTWKSLPDLQSELAKKEQIIREGEGLPNDFQTEFQADALRKRIDSLKANPSEQVDSGTYSMDQIKKRKTFQGPSNASINQPTNQNTMAQQTPAQLGIVEQPNGTATFQNRNYENLGYAQAAAQRVLATGGTITPIPDAPYNANQSNFSYQGSSAPQASSSTLSSAMSGNMQAGLDILNNSGLSEGEKSLFRQILQDWKPNDAVNAPAILAKFQEIKQTTIDPYFREQANVFTDQINNSYNVMKQQRGMQLESEQEQAKQNIEGTQANLEARGMTFSGEGLKQLGTQSAYAPEGQQRQAGQIPSQFGGEGLVQKQNRLMSSSSQANYMQGLRNLQRQAETTLGSAGSQGFAPEVQQLGFVKETAQLPGQQKQAEASTLTGLYNQGVQNYQQNQNIKPYNQ